MSRCIFCGSSKIRDEKILLEFIGFMADQHGFELQKTGTYDVLSDDQLDEFIEKFTKSDKYDLL